MKATEPTPKKAASAKAKPKFARYERRERIYPTMEQAIGSEARLGGFSKPRKARFIQSFH